MKAAGGGFGGGPWLSAAPNAPCNQRSYLCHLARSRLPFLCISPLCLRHKLSRLSSPPFLRPFSFQQEDTCVWEVVVFLPLLLQPAPPAPSHCCRPQLCVCFTAAVKDKKQSFPPPLLFSGRMSLSFPWFLCPRWISEQLPPSKGYLRCLPSPIFFFLQRGINNFTETFIERLIAGTSHGSVVVRKTLQRQTQVFGGVSKGLVTTGVFKELTFSDWVKTVCGNGGFSVLAF